MQARKMLTILLLSTLVLAACSQATPTPEAMMGEETPTAMLESSSAMMETATSDAMMASSDDMMATSTAEAMMGQSDDMMGTPTPEAMMGSENGMMAVPAWFTATLTQATSGASFAIQDYEGKVVLVETMAVWCTTCFAQQQQIQELHNLLGMAADLVSISLDIDPNEDNAVLKSYVEKNGFDWTYAVAPKEVAREIGLLYGDQFLNPPSAPMFIIDRHGEVHPLPFGVKSADDLKKAVEPYLNTGM